jgi:hypothetical protein
MKTSVVPRLDAAALRALSLARAAQHRRRPTSNIVSLVHAADRGDARQPTNRAERTPRTMSMFWLLHAR